MPHALLHWIILTACRFNEAYEMDIDAEVKGDTWTIPGIRMKADKKHCDLVGPAKASATIPDRSLVQAFRNLRHQYEGSEARSHYLQTKCNPDQSRSICGDAVAELAIHPVPVAKPDHMALFTT